MRSLAFTASITLVLACGDQQPTPRPADVDPRVDPVTASAVRNIDSFPRLPGETQDAPRFNRAIAAMREGDVLQLNAATTYSIRSAIQGWKSNTTLQGVDWSTVMKVDAPGLSLITVVGRTGFAIRNLKLQGFATSGLSGNNAINMADCTNSQVANVRIESFPWQGIVLSGASHDNCIDRVTVTNCKDASSGTGILLWGIGVTANSVTNITAQFNRIGVSLNYAHHNTLDNIVAHDNTSIGFTLDGIGPGQGANDNTIGAVTADRNGAVVRSYGGVYLGNTSHGNVLASISCSNNFSNGLYLNSAHHNTFQSITVVGNQLNGIRNLQGDGNHFGSAHLWSHNNGQNGIFLQSGDGIKVGAAGIFHRSQWNGGAGFYLANRVTRSFVYDLLSEGNAGRGVEAQAGGTPWSNWFPVVRSTGNAGADLLFGTPCHYW